MTWLSDNWYYLLFFIVIIVLIISNREKGKDYEDVDYEEYYSEEEYEIEYNDDGFNDEYEDEDDEDDKHEEEKDISKQDNTVFEIPKIRLMDIAGLEDAKKALDEKVILPIKHKALFEKYNKKFGGGILLFGLPGTGKTMFAQAVATELNAKFFSIKCSDIMSKWYGESESNIKKLFVQAKKQSISVIFFDEFEALGKKRNNENNYNPTINEILAQMQGVETNNNMLLVIAATNCPWELDGALLRPGRFDEKIYIPLPDKKAIQFITTKSLKNIKFDGVDWDNISQKLLGFNGADIENFCEKVKMYMIKKELQNQNDLKISNDEIQQILSTIKTSVQQYDLDKMQEYLSNKEIA